MKRIIFFISIYASLNAMEKPGDIIRDAKGKQYSVVSSSYNQILHKQILLVTDGVHRYYARLQASGVYRMRIERKVGACS